MFPMRNLRPLTALIALCLLTAGIAGLIREGSGLSQTSTVVDGVPLEVLRDPGLPEHRSGIVIAHGFGGSAAMMRPYAQTLARQGFLVVSLDFSGHGTNLYPLPLDPSRRLQQDLAVAVSHLRTLGVPLGRIGLLGHSMGADAVVRYAGQRPRIHAVVTLSLPTPTPPSPSLLMLAGSLEPSAFHHEGVRLVPLSDHFTILFSPEAHRLTGEFFATAFGAQPADPAPWNRLIYGALLALAFTAGLTVLPKSPYVIVPYSLAAVTLPVHLSLTSVLLTGWRWLLLPVAVICCFAACYGLLLAARKNVWRYTGYGAAGLVLLTVLALAGLAPGFFLLIMPLLFILLVWNATWIRLLTTDETPPWLPPLAGALLIAIPIAAATPIPALPLP